MARVNHKLVKERLNEKRSKITDRQFFSSRMLAGYYEDMAAAQTRRYKYNRRVRVNLYWKPKDSNVALTDNLQVRINTGHPLVTKIKGRENRYWIVTGLFAHELGHILYTDFLATQTYHNFLNSYRWYPTYPAIASSKDLANEKDLMAYMKEGKHHLAAVQCVAHDLLNILEDGYIENRMMNNFPGTLSYALVDLRDKMWEEMPSVTDLIESEDNGDRHIFESIMQIMLSYAKYGEIKYGEAPLSDIRIQTVFKLIPAIDNALLSMSIKDRFMTVNLILVRCWEQIKELCEIYRDLQEQAEAAGVSGTISENIAGSRKGLIGNSAVGSGNSAPVPEMSSNDKMPSATEDKRMKTRVQAGASEKEEEKGEDEKAGSSEEDGNSNVNGDAEGSEKGDEAETENHTPSPEEESDGDDSAPPMGSVPFAGKQETSAEETRRIKKHQTEALSVPTGGSVETDSEYKRHMYDKVASDIERVLEHMAEKAACAELENERLQELNDAAQNISYGDIHSGVNIRVHRIADVDEELVDQFHEISNPLLAISHQLQRSLVKQLKESRRGGKQTGLLMGRRLDSHALHRNDGKLFYKNALPSETPELAVGLLLDESGSMSGSDRCTYARASAIILYDFCQGLHIPVMVYGHSTSWSEGVDLYSYAEFDSIDHDDRYRMMDIGARGSNRDGAALRYVAENLSRRPEQIKLLILVSDGQPADTGYSGSAAEEDLRGIKQEYQRKGILFVAAAIGNDKENIERIYGDSFMDITDLTQLPVKLTGVVKRFIRV